MNNDFENFMSDNFAEPEWDEGWTRADIELAWETQQKKIKILKSALEDIADEVIFDGEIAGDMRDMAQEALDLVNK